MVDSSAANSELLCHERDSKLFHRPLIVGANRPLQTNFSIRPFRTYVRPPVNFSSLKEGLIVFVRGGPVLL